MNSRTSKRWCFVDKAQIIKTICIRAIFGLAIMLSACGQSSAFDTSKAASLSEDRRRELDIQLANELETYNTNTERCPIDFNDPYKSFECRVAIFKQMAAEGYEMADIADKIFNPLRGEIRKDRSAYERLRKLADDGDKSALCFAPRIFIWFLQDTDWPYTAESEMKYNKQGVAQGLPLCILNEAYSYKHGESGYPIDLNKAHQLALKAASAGLYGGHELLFIQYKQSLGIYDTNYRYKYNDLPAIRKALCWGRLAGHHSVAANLRGFTGSLSRASRDKDDQSKLIYPELEQLSEDWDIGFTPYEQKPTTIQDCLKIEEEN